LIANKSIEPPVQTYQTTSLFGTTHMFWNLVQQLDLSICAVQRTNTVRCTNQECARNGLTQSLFELQNFRLPPKNGQLQRHVLAPLTVELTAVQTEFVTCVAAYSKLFSNNDAQVPHAHCSGAGRLQRETTALPLLLPFDIDVDQRTPRQNMYSVFDFPHLYRPLANNATYRLKNIILSNMQNHFTNCLNVASENATHADLIYVDNRLSTRAVPVLKAENQLTTFFPVFVVYLRI